MKDPLCALAVFESMAVAVIPNGARFESFSAEGPWLVRTRHTFQRIGQVSQEGFKTAQRIVKFRSNWNKCIQMKRPRKHKQQS